MKLWEVQWNQLNDSVQVIQKKAGTGQNHGAKTWGKMPKKSEWWVDLGVLQWMGAVI